MGFERPESSKYPQVYATFQAGGEKFHISDLTEDHWEEALTLLVKYVIPEETFCRAIKIHKKPNAMKFMIDSYRRLFKEKVSLACFKAATGELVGLNILAVKTKGESKEPVRNFESNFKNHERILFQPTDPDIIRLRESALLTDPRVDVFEQFNVEHYLHGHGLGVAEGHRGKGIAVEILKARIPLLRAIGLTTTSTTFSTLSSQKAAIKAGYSEVYSVSYDDIRGKLPDFDLSEATGTHCINLALQA